MGKRQLKSIAQKLQSLILSTLFVALFVMLTTTVINDVFTYRQVLVDNLSTLARAIGTHAAPAIARQDAEVASRLLVTFSAEQSLLGALIVLRDGHVFAEYSLGLNPDQGTRRFPPSLWEELDDTRVTFHLHNIELLAPIRNKSETIAAVVLQASPASLYERLFWKLLATVIQFSAAIVLALLVSARIKRQIAQPITDLARAMKQVSNEKKYNVQVQKRDNDEIGALIDGFNQMLAQIRQRDEQLESLATRDPIDLGGNPVLADGFGIGGHGKRYNNCHYRHGDQHFEQGEALL